MSEVFSAFHEKSRHIKSVDVKSVKITYDTNCLLDLFRCSDKSRPELISLIKNINESFGHFLTHHVAIEFGLNKDRAESDSRSQMDFIVKSFNSFKKNVNNSSSVSGYDTPISGLKGEISESLESIWKCLEQYKAKLDKKSPSANLFDEISSIFENKVLPPYAVNSIQEAIHEANIRFDNQIPPGYKDVGKTNVVNYYGYPIESKYADFLIWRQLIDYAKENGTDVIFITSEQKPDWVENIRGASLIRSDLALEFEYKTKQRIYICSLSRFENQFRKMLSFSITSDTKKELAEIEATNSWFDDVYNAFLYYGREVSLNEVYEYIENNCSRKLPPTWQSTVRRTIYNHSSDVGAFLGVRDVFQRLSKGKWLLR